MGITPANAWKLGVGAVAAILVAYVPLRDTAVGPSVYSLASLLACIAFFAGPALQRARAPQWKLFGAGMFLYWVADAIWAVAWFLGYTLPYPSVADGFYLVAYALFTAGALVLLRGSRASTGDILDGLLVATTAAFLIWPLVIAPSASGSTVLERVVSGAYPTFDVLLLIGLAPVALSSRARSVSHAALLAGFLTLLAADLVYAVMTLKGIYTDSNLINLFWIASSGFLVLAALHPSIRRLTEPVPARPGVLGRARLGIIAAALAVGPFVDVALPVGAHTVAPIASATAIGLVVARIVVLWRERDRADRALKESEARYRDLYAVAEASRDQLEAQNVRLQELDRMKDSFVSLVSHELRTPLTSIHGYVELLADEEVSADEATRQRHLEVVQRNSERLLVLVNDLLFMSQVQTDRQILELVETGLRPLAEDCIEAARPAADAQGVSLALHADVDPKGGGRPVPLRPGARQPALERDQVLAPGRASRAAPPARRRPGADRDRRRGPRHRERRPRLPVHAVLPHRVGHSGRRPRHGPRPRRLESDRRCTRRHDLGHERRRRWHDLHGRPAYSRRSDWTASPSPCRASNSVLDLSRSTLLQGVESGPHCLELLGRVTDPVEELVDDA